MTDEAIKTIADLIKTIFSPITAALAAWILWKLQSIGKSVDGKMDKLLQVSKIADNATGKEEGRLLEKGEQHDREVAVTVSDQNKKSLARHIRKTTNRKPTVTK